MNGKVWVVVLFFIVIGIFIYVDYYNSKKAKIKRKLKKAVGKKISDFVSGEVAKVVGTVECVGEPLIAPLSRRNCVHYYVRVEHLVGGGKNRHWETLFEENVATLFVIRDGKKCALVDSRNVKSYIVEDRGYSSGFLEDATDVQKKYLQAHGHVSEGAFGFNKALRYKEGILEDGELIAVVGKGEWSVHEKLPESYGRVLVINSTDVEPVYLSDDPDTVETTNVLSNSNY